MYTVHCLFPAKKLLRENFVENFENFIYAICTSNESLGQDETPHVKFSNFFR